MQQKNSVRQSSGAVAIALDKRILLAQYRLFLLLASVLSAAFALGLHRIFAR